MSVEPFNRLVKLAARSFYDDYTPKGDNQPKTGRSDNRGIAVVVLDALTRRQWVREEDLAKDLKLHSKQLRRTLKFFEDEKLVTRDHRKETAKGAKMYSAAVAATADGQQFGKEGDKKIKLHTHSYCCLDYAQIYDVVRYRLHRMRKKLKDAVDKKDTIQTYICNNCGKRYTAFEALQLISEGGDYFQCGNESCKTELVAESDKLASQDGGDGDDNAKKRREKINDMLQKMEGQLKPLIEQLDRVKGLDPPEFGTLQAWEAQAAAAGRAVNGDSSSNDPSKSSQGYGGTPMPFLGDPKVEVALPGSEGKEADVKSETGSTSLKVLPPWMIKAGMNLTSEQRGEVKQESKMDGSSAAGGFSDDKKSTVEDDKASLQDEYVKAYYAALLKKQQELEEAAEKQQEFSNKPVSDGLSGMSSERQVGSKSKRDEDDGDDDSYWADDPTPTPAAGNTSGSYKVIDLNVEAEAEASGEDDDDIEWEEG